MSETAFLADYDDLTTTLPGASHDWVTALRGHGIDTYRRLGLPKPKTEAWKFTNLNALTRQSFGTPAANDSAIAPGGLPQPLLGGPRVVLLDGRFRADLSVLGDLPSSVRIVSLADALEAGDHVAERELSALSGEDRPFAALNLAHLSDGILIDIDAHADVKMPIEIAYLASGSGNPTAFHPRAIIVAGTHSRATIVETHGTLTSKAVYLANGATWVRVSPGAQLTHIRIQEESPKAFHIQTLDAVVERDATFDNFVFTLGARLSRNELLIHIAGEGATAHVNGTYMIAGDQHADTASKIDHRIPHGTSNQTYQGVIADKGRAVFQGKIHVHPQAQKTDGYQLNRALLLSDNAEIDSKPELEIYADDVKCSHGATTGQIDADQLFYLRARGIPEAAARALLIESFVGEVLALISDETLREILTARAHNWLVAQGDIA